MPDPTRDQNFPKVGSESHFLSVCAVDDDCMDPASCICGACTLPCDADALCSYLDVTARCVAVGPSCPEAAVVDQVCAIACDLDSDCGPGGTCVDGGCRTPATGPLGPRRQRRPSRCRHRHPLRRAGR